MKRVLAIVMFLGLYFLGVLAAWSVPVLQGSWWTVLVALVWFFVVSTVVPRLVAKLGWTASKSH